MKKCTRCLVPETVDTISFDDEGVCSVCRQVEQKDSIDWIDRRRQLDVILEQYVNKDIYENINDDIGDHIGKMIKNKPHFFS